MNFWYTLILLLVVAVVILLFANSNNQKYNTQQINNMANNTINFCPNCGAEVNKNAIVCVKCGCAISSRAYNGADVPSVGLNIVSFLFPIIGLILYLVYYQNSPIKANALGKWALISFGINIVVLILSTL